jgi:hypothetical protein
MTKPVIARCAITGFVVFPWSYAFRSIAHAVIRSSNDESGAFN